MNKGFVFNCPCCGKPSLLTNHSGETCRECGWIDLKEQFVDPDLGGGPNKMSLNFYRSLNEVLAEITN